MLDAEADMLSPKYGEVQHDLHLQLKTVFVLCCASALKIWQGGLIESVPFLLESISFYLTFSRFHVTFSCTFPSV